MPPHGPLTYWVVVLGDFGRSPRMQRHTLSIANAAPTAHIHVLAHGGSAPLSELMAISQRVHIHNMPQLPSSWQRFLPRLLLLMLKVLYQTVWLCWLLLLVLPPPASILLQTPPALPTMSMCWLAARRHRARFVLDWHNFGYTIMRMDEDARRRANPGARGKQRARLLIAAARAYERFWGRHADAHLTVTRAMANELSANWRIPHATVLYDCPPAAFRRIPLPAVHALFGRLTHGLAAQRFNDFLTPMLNPSTAAAALAIGVSATVVTEHRQLDNTTSHTGSSSGTSSDGGGYAWRSDRPVVLVSSTSWTSDEDFGMLLDALVEYDGRAALKPHLALPRVLLLITGKGPTQAQYLKRIALTQLSIVAIRTLWLDPADYPLLLGSADLGVSLHASSSGLDLPMKVVDMFGCGLPVLALSYSCITELVSDGQTGLLFSNAAQLANLLIDVLSGWQERRVWGSESVPADGGKELLGQLQRGVMSRRERGLTWEDSWMQVAWPVVQK